MFDIGFTEILLIAVVSLIVIGPKRLPEAIRFLGYWLGKLRRSVQGAREEMEREFGLDEIRRELYNEELLGRMANERKQIKQRLNAPPSNTEAPIPASLKVPTEDDFIDDAPGEHEADNEATVNPQTEVVTGTHSVSDNDTAPETTTNKP